MLELLLCSMLTILPDYLYRRLVQGKRFGKEITFFSVWFELRWGIITCLMLTISLITRDLLLPSVDQLGDAVLQDGADHSRSGWARRRGPCRLQRPGRQGRSDLQARQLQTGSRAGDGPAENRRGRRIAHLGASGCAEDRRPDTGGEKLSFSRRKDELDVKSELQRRNPGIVPQRDIEKLQVMVDGRQGSLDAANASKQSAELRVSTLLPAEKASAEAALAQAQVDYDKTFVRAGVAGRVEQFFLRVGDIVNPLMRPAGILIPEGAGQRCAAGRLRTDRGPGHEAGHGGGGHMRLEAVDHHPDGRHKRAGLHRGRSVPRRRAASRSPERRETGHDPGVPGAALQGRARGGDGGQQLHRQCLYQQPRADLFRETQHGAEFWSARRRRGRAGSCACCCGSRRCCCRSRRWC